MNRRLSRLATAPAAACARSGWRRVDYNSFHATTNKSAITKPGKSSWAESWSNGRARACTRGCSSEKPPEKAAPPARLTRQSTLSRPSKKVSIPQPQFAAFQASTQFGKRLGIGFLESNDPSEDGWAADEFELAQGPVQLLSVFDGHGGCSVSQYLQKHLLPMIREHLPTEGLDVDAVGDALRQSYRDAESKLEAQNIEGLASGVNLMGIVGSCAITVAVTPSHLVVANVGDCQAVVGRKDGSVQELNSLHTANNTSEAMRIRRAHPNDPMAIQCFPNKNRGTPDCYVKGFLTPSRAFGDFALKSVESNVDDEGNDIVPELLSPPYITADPEVRTFSRGADDKVLVVGTDGLFDDLEPDEVVQIALKAGDPDLAARKLVQAAQNYALLDAFLSEQEYADLDRSYRRRVHDDVTCLVYFWN